MSVAAARAKVVQRDGVRKRSWSERVPRISASLRQRKRCCICAPLSRRNALCSLHSGHVTGASCFHPGRSAVTPARSCERSLRSRRARRESLPMHIQGVLGAISFAASQTARRNGAADIAAVVAISASCCHRGRASSIHQAGASGGGVGSGWLRRASTSSLAGVPACAKMKVSVTVACRATDTSSCHNRDPHQWRWASAPRASMDTMLCESVRMRTRGWLDPRGSAWRCVLEADGKTESFCGEGACQWAG